ncbi:MAG TPA: hypothetical protein VKG44_03285 [Candidatus Baltobacteraceae bacterium]|nr:hypothetical protein [Candidatus Baltobacteraceae bacterium]
MRRLVRSEGYARTKLVTGMLLGILGAVIIVRTLAGVGLTWAAIPALVLGLAMLALGFVRLREYRARKRTP